VKRPLAILATTIFFFLAPGFVAGVFPFWITRWQVAHRYIALQAAGILFIVAGFVLLFDSFARFALLGRGTPAPVAPTERLVITGGYRYVRNPMYVSVLAMILGQALFFGSIIVVSYGAAMWLVSFLFVLFYEEPALRRRYGAEYERYCANVGRWIPRLTPWRR
jgi:protein-S-isoprenylcysteine O-methyltransferase Ste14